MTLKELMQLCYNAGVEDMRQAASAVVQGEAGNLDFPTWWEQYGEERHDAWWQDHGMRLLHGYRTSSPSDVAADEEHAEVLFNIHTVVASNNAMLTLMIEAMQEMEPDEVLDPEGQVWTVTAETDDGTHLAYTVRCLTWTDATKAATLAWGHGGWETLKRRRVAVDD